MGKTSSLEKNKRFSIIYEQEIETENEVTFQPSDGQQGKADTLSRKGSGRGARRHHQRHHETGQPLRVYVCTCRSAVVKHLPSGTKTRVHSPLRQPHSCWAAKTKTLQTGRAGWPHESTGAQEETHSHRNRWAPSTHSMWPEKGARTQNVYFFIMREKSI